MLLGFPNPDKPEPKRFSNFLPKKARNSELRYYISVKRSVNRLRKEGPEGFFKTEAKARTPHVLTDKVVEKIQGYLNKGYSPAEIAEKLELKANTIRKAIQAGRLRKKKQKTEQQQMDRS
jgi:DNA-binding NarL/FixJ family response regulator